MARKKKTLSPAQKAALAYGRAVRRSNLSARANPAESTVRRAIAKADNPLARRGKVLRKGDFDGVDAEGKAIRLTEDSARAKRFERDLAIIKKAVAKGERKQPGPIRTYKASAALGNPETQGPSREGLLELALGLSQELNYVKTNRDGSTTPITLTANDVAYIPRRGYRLTFVDENDMVAPSGSALQGIEQALKAANARWARREGGEYTYNSTSEPGDMAGASKTELEALEATLDKQGLTKAEIAKVVKRRTKVGGTKAVTGTSQAMKASTVKRLEKRIAQLEAFKSEIPRGQIGNWEFRAAEGEAWIRAAGARSFRSPNGKAKAKPYADIVKRLMGLKKFTKDPAISGLDASAVKSLLVKGRAEAKKRWAASQSGAARANPLRANGPFRANASAGGLMGLRELWSEGAMGYAKGAGAFVGGFALNGFVQSAAEGMIAKVVPDARLASLVVPAGLAFALYKAPGPIAQVPQGIRTALIGGVLAGAFARELVGGLIAKIPVVGPMIAGAAGGTAGLFAQPLGDVYDDAFDDDMGELYDDMGELYSVGTDGMGRYITEGGGGQHSVDGMGRYIVSENAEGTEGLGRYLVEDDGGVGALYEESGAAGMDGDDDLYAVGTDGLGAVAKVPVNLQEHRPAALPEFSQENLSLLTSRGVWGEPVFGGAYQPFQGGPGGTPGQ